jgi:hypothetical protein
MHTVKERGKTMNKNGVTSPHEWDGCCGNCQSDAAWETIDVAIRQLEEAWRHTSQPDIANFVPPAGNPLRLRVLVELIKADQECCWKSGIPTKIEDYLHAWPELLGQVRLIVELLDSECLTRAMFNAMPTCEELCSRFPTLGEQVDLTRIAAIIHDVE